MRISVAQWKITRAYGKDVERAKASGEPHEEIQNIRNQEFSDWRFEEDVMMDLRSERLMRVARRLLLPLPDFNDPKVWEDSQVSKRRLTEKAQRDLILAIRAERKDRFEGWRSWLPAFAAGLSAIAAWVAALRR